MQLQVNLGMYVIRIGLFLLRDLTNGMDSSDEEEQEEDNNWRRLRYSRWSVGKNDDSAAYCVGSCRASHSG